MSNRVRLFLCLLLLGFGFLAHVEAEPEIIAKARAYLGSEAALNNVRSIHYVGTMMAADTSVAGQMPGQAKIEIFFDRPFRHRIITTGTGRIEMAGLNDLEGWSRQQDPTNSERWRLTLLPRDQIKRLRANTWENLSFFRGLEQQGGKVEDLGTVTVPPGEGQPNSVVCEKVAFRHADNIVFIRYFEKATGRLLVTETEEGGSIREQGEVIVDGIRFPQVIVTSLKGQDGKIVPVTVKLEKITVNEKFPDELFAVPMLSTK